MNWLKDINVLIFDMDGTLYQDYTFLGRYIEKMMNSHFSAAEIEETVSLAYRILEGNQAVKLGNFYDAERLVFFSHRNLKPDTSFDWHGTELESPTAEADSLTYIGDPWGVAQLMARKHNILQPIVEQAFNDVRTEMLQEAYCIIKEADLFEEIRQLKDKRLILMTNSPLPTGQEFIDFLGLDGIFDEIYIDGKKPFGLRTLLKKLETEGVEPQEILSVGDHPWNDLHPVHQAGGYTCLISKYKHDDETPWSVTVESMNELTELMRKMNGEIMMPSGKEETYG